MHVTIPPEISCSQLLAVNEKLRTVERRERQMGTSPASIAAERPWMMGEETPLLEISIWLVKY